MSASSPRTKPRSVPSENPLFGEDKIRQPPASQQESQWRKRGKDQTTDGTFHFCFHTLILPKQNYQGLAFSLRSTFKPISPASHGHNTRRDWKDPLRSSVSASGHAHPPCGCRRCKSQPHTRSRMNSRESIWRRCSARKSSSSYSFGLICKGLIIERSLRGGSGQ